MSIPNSQPLYKGDVSQAGSSDSDSDDISRSLSILLSQQLQQQQQQQPQQGPKRFHTIGLLPHGGDYTNALEDILGFGIDGARRVISMPNPIGNSLPLDMSINAHTQALIGMPVISSLGIEKTASDGSSQDYRLAATSDVAYPQVSAALPTGASDNSPSDGLLCLQSDLCTVPMPVGKPESLAARGRGGGIPSSPLIPETHKAVAGLVGKRDVPTAVSSPEKSTVGKLRGTAMRKPNASTAPATPRAKRGRPPLVHKQNGTKGASGGPPMLEIKAMDQQSAASDVPLASTLYPADSSSIMVGPSAHQLGIGRCGLPPSGESQPLADSSGCGEPASVDTPRSMHTPSLASSTPTSAVSALIPHRVDRQLAAASRPLLFVRPRSKDDQPRRRKRRCVSSNPAIPLGSAPATVKGGPADALGPPANGALLKGGEAPGSLVADGGQNNLQWQRISEQRRRDAMRENFDLLKRMLPQAYMASDDGRELARPVLLARFLRWVDDTLMEMESLKSEVARLRLVVQGTGQTPHAKTSGVWQQLLGGEAGGVSGLSAPHPHHQLTTVFGQPNNLGLQGPD
ncbi:hypothetical protein GQ54DRAFT_299254 [Martensiomyces pterosporus]|nr:hypothetical protein GQ54DRAFT_299254 [Martensiomyces pterosporus]